MRGRNSCAFVWSYDFKLKKPQARAAISAQIENEQKDAPGQPQPAMNFCEPVALSSAGLGVADVTNAGAGESGLSAEGRAGTDRAWACRHPEARPAAGLNLTQPNQRKSFMQGTT